MAFPASFSEKLQIFLIYFIDNVVDKGGFQRSWSDCAYIWKERVDLFILFHESILFYWFGMWKRLVLILFKLLRNFRNFPMWLLLSKELKLGLKETLRSFFKHFNINFNNTIIESFIHFIVFAFYLGNCFVKVPHESSLKIFAFLLLPFVISSCDEFQF